LYFRGGVTHGNNCKRRGTWVRREAMRVLAELPGADFTATEGDLSAAGGSSKEEAAAAPPKATTAALDGLRGQHLKDVNFSATEYTAALRRSRWCLHLRGDTTTSRRVFDAVAAGCVPIVVSDHVHLPFASQIDYNQFTVTVSEVDLFDNGAAALAPILANNTLLKQKQAALLRARQDVLYGFGSPFGASDSGAPGEAAAAAFESRVPDHILQQAFELAQLDGRYRRYPNTFANCMLGEGAK